MWRLLKAENNYNKETDLVLYGVIIFSFLVNSIYGNLEMFLTWLMFAGASYFSATSNFSWIKTKRVRFLAGLPIPVRKLQIVRHARFIAYVAIWAVLFSFSSLISQRGHLGIDYYCWVLTKISCAFIFVGSLNLAMNIYYCRKSGGSGKYFITIASSFFVFSCYAGLILFMFSSFPPSFYNNLFLITLSEMLLTFPASFVLLLFSLVIFILDIFVFGMRKTYIEESSWFFKL